MRRRRCRRQFVCLVLAFKVRQLVLLPLRTAGVLSPAQLLRGDRARVFTASIKRVGVCCHPASPDLRRV